MTLLEKENLEKISHQKNNKPLIWDSHLSHIDGRLALSLPSYPCFTNGLSVVLSFEFAGVERKLLNFFNFGVHSAIRYTSSRVAQFGPILQKRNIPIILIHVV